VDGGVGDGEAGGVGFVEAGGVEGEGGAADRVDEPDVGDAHGVVVGEDFFGTGEAVFRREDFDAKEGRGECDPLARSISSEESKIGYADATFSYANTLFHDALN